MLYHPKALKNGRVVKCLHPTLLSCLFSVKPQAGQAAYLFQAWSLETIACNLNLRGCGGLKLTVDLL
jgi:hypothetical protein